jgi:hypothetical protein
VEDDMGTVVPDGERLQKVRPDLTRVRLRVYSEQLSLGSDIGVPAGGGRPGAAAVQSELAYDDPV